VPPVSFLTDFADQAVILPVATAIFLLLGASGWWRGALAWIFCVGATLAAIGMGKLLLLACGPVQLGAMLASPSGHTAAATVVYGGLLVLLWRGSGPVQRRARTICVVAIAALIGATRIALGAHTWPDVVAGALVGLTGIACLLRLAGPPPRPRIARLLAVMIVVIGIMHGTHLRAESDIHGFAHRLAALLPGCGAPVTQTRP
jgi:membrane-associated phospholipid phosphatase